MRIFILTLLLLLNISCQRQDCDLEYYPSPPYGNPDHTDYYDPQGVKYVYMCYSGSYNRIVDYQVVGDCWEMFTEEEYNLNCN